MNNEEKRKEKLLWFALMPLVNSIQYSLQYRYTCTYGGTTPMALAIFGNIDWLIDSWHKKQPKLIIDHNVRSNKKVVDRNIEAGIFYLIKDCEINHHFELGCFLIYLLIDRLIENSPRRRTLRFASTNPRTTPTNGWDRPTFCSAELSLRPPFPLLGVKFKFKSSK